MKFTNIDAEIYIPDSPNIKPALTRTTHLGIGAHQDDLEIMAINGILKCFQNPQKWFTGVVVTDGRGAPRSGIYTDYTDTQIMTVRTDEQKKAAVIGEYAGLVLLKYPSSSVKDPGNMHVIEDLAKIIRRTRPDVVYTHNLADKHPTHVGVAVKVIKALRSLPPDYHPTHFYGCEVWRDLDWMVDTGKVALDCSGRKDLQTALLGAFDSQISGGKRYDLAAKGRRVANATYYASHDVDNVDGLTFAMDLLPLIKDPNLDIQAYVQNYIQQFAEDVSRLISSVL